MSLIDRRCRDCPNPPRSGRHASGESVWGSNRFKRDENPWGPKRFSRFSRGCDECKLAENLERAIQSHYVPRDEAAIQQLSDEEFERELDRTLGQATRAMDRAVEQGEFTPRKIAAAIRDFRRRRPYRSD